MGNKTWGSNFHTSAPAAVAADPNTTEPTSTAYGTSGSFIVPDNYTPGAGNTRLMMAVGSPATATVTVTIWLKDPTAKDATKKWYPIATGVVVTYGTASYVSLPPAAEVWLQVTAVANAPDEFYAGFSN